MGRSRLSRSPSSSDRAPPDFYVTTERLRNFTGWGRNNDATFVFSRENSSVSRRGFSVLICFKAVSNRMSHAVWWLATLFLPYNSYWLYIALTFVPSLQNLFIYRVIKVVLLD